MFDISTDKLKISDLWDLIQSNELIMLNSSSMSNIKKSRLFIEKSLDSKNGLIYGINTGFGSLCNTEINSNNIDELQEKLILSHSCGMGGRVPKKIIRLILLLKIRSLSFGYSGVRLELIEKLIFFYNNDIIPVIFKQGSLGASGDLAPLAHLSLPLLGKGEVYFNDRILPSSEVLKKFNTKKIKLSFKEGLALINGTQFMCGYGVWCIYMAHKIYNLSNLIACISLEAFDCRYEPFDKFVSKIRPHNGQIHTTNQIRKILDIENRNVTTEKHVQDPYSFRCIPQVHGATYDVIKHVESVFQIEINSTTDNPNIFHLEKKIISAGNFHGQALAMAMDYLAISLSELANISERRIYKLISGERNLPEYLIDDPGLNSGFMITQYTAASIVSQNKQLASPASVDSIVSSNGQEDHVSMGANSATKLNKIVENVISILSIEIFNAAQALDLREKDSTKMISKLIKLYREEVPKIKSDCQMNLHIEKSRKFLFELDEKKLLKTQN